MAMQFKYFIPQNFTHFLAECRDLFSYPEPALFYSFPYSGVERRIEQIIQDHQSLFSAPLVHIRLSNVFEDPADIALYMQQKGFICENSKVNVFISNIEYLIQTRNSGIFPWLFKMQTDNQQLRLIFFSELYLSRADIDSLGSIHIVGNIRYYPLYSKENSRLFIEYLAAKWEMKLTDSTLHTLVKQCGGHLWILKQAVRILRDIPDYPLEQLYDHEAIQYRLSSLYQSLNKEELEIIFDPHNTKFPDRRYHLERLGLIEKNTCTLPFLQTFVQKHWKRIQISLQDSTLLFNNIPVNQLFSRAELRVLKLFLMNKNKPLTRDEIAQELWKDAVEEKYSDWAIDQLIKRLRNKLQQLGLTAGAIKTIRSFGYQFQY
ncbi:helix-turn-helix domain-containing protein [Candidatus Roizmanbacteria bacterium]|nr:helix-turn-helix domain-containing protein [Candidatus Roizmanbacteria bacterium]